MYQKDLSINNYSGKPKPNVLAVGWLSKDHSFTWGTTDPDIVTELKHRPIVNRCKGSHNCEFCNYATYKEYHDNGASGNGEIIVKSKSGIYYVMPVLVVHYIEVHNYRLPLEVEEALK
jgi:hypothetical protein